MKRLYIPLLGILITAGTLYSVAAQSNDISQTIVYVNGVKYYVHTVKAGDTLYSISKSYGVDLESITKHNPSASDGLKIDQTLKIPLAQQEPNIDKKRKKKDFEFHTVAAGETLYSISRLYAVSIETILADNADIDPAHISIGTRLYIRRSEMGQAPRMVTHTTLCKVETRSTRYVSVLAQMSRLCVHSTTFRMV